MAPQKDLVACGLILTYDDEADEQIANVALVLNNAEWSDAATEAFDQARASAWAALSPLNVIPMLLCRTRAEHTEFSKSEPHWSRALMATADEFLQASEALIDSVYVLLGLNPMNRIGPYS